MCKYHKTCYFVLLCLSHVVLLYLSPTVCHLVLLRLFHLVLLCISSNPSAILFTSSRTSASTTLSHSFAYTTLSGTSASNYCVYLVAPFVPAISSCNVT